ncbi:MAG: ABC transporter ATP-binding protein, partial [Myxococcales bacterium]|nr:ABC transporter ATP-binding protein [Myxococcales bacterium]
GENGAGKSTLMKIVHGSVRPDAGVVRWNGEALPARGPAQARALGIAMVFQHFSLFEALTVAENVWLGADRRSSLASVTARLLEVAKEYGLEIDPRRPTHSLGVGERQRVEILRALLARPSLLILDEPTSVLDPRSVERLFVTLRKLAADGCSILYTSHKLDEIRALCARCTVLRAGRVTGEVEPKAATNAMLSRMMIGAEPPVVARTPPRRGEVALEVEALDLPRQGPFGVSLSAVDLAVRAGEIVGIAGVSGNGQQELLAALSGEDPRGTPGSVRLHGVDVTRAGPRRRRALGLRFVPEERLGRAAVPALSLADNVLLTRHERGFGRTVLRRGPVAAAAGRIIDRFAVKTRGPEAPARSLSGGNLQRFIVGREIDGRPTVLVVSQPTWGVDVGAAAVLRAELVRLRDEGCAVLVVSEELDELFEISDTIVVIARGRLSPPRPVHDVSVEQLGEWMGGTWREGGAGAAAALEAAHATH